MESDRILARFTYGDFQEANRALVMWFRERANQGVIQGYTIYDLVVKKVREGFKLGWY